MLAEAVYESDSYKVEFNAGSFPTDRSYLGENRIVHVVTDVANDIIAYKSCPMTMTMKGVTRLVQSR